jgi:Immunity protein 27
MNLKPDETDLQCEWNFVDGKMIGNDVCDRIDFLVKHHLKKVAGGGWETLYVDPNDGRYWEKTYPQSEMHGGGPARLSVLSKEEAEAKYGKLP